jgi:Xaa-Pro aminopeptidase
MHDSRRDKLRKSLKRLGVGSLLVTNFKNVTWLTGFTGDDSFLLLLPNDEILISDPRYETQIEEECSGLKTFIRRPGMLMPEAAARVIKESKASLLGIEGLSMTVALREHLAANLPNATLQTTSGVVEGLRQIKDAQEIEETRQAIRFAEKAFGVLRAAISPDQTEKQVADQLENQMRLFGASGSSFPPIVAVGPRAALPHYRPGERRIGESEFTLVDWGARGKLYTSDLTRMVVTGKISPKLERVYRVVLKAQIASIAAVKPGLTCHELDGIARGIISDEGFGRHFGHGLGHGIGLDIHESPGVRKDNQQHLQPGMIVTIEPGVYLPGWGGVRIEDDVLVTRSGHEVLTSLPKALESAVV